jgi:membrane protein implicated in regulation of membrane protease activity
MSPPVRYALFQLPGIVGVAALAFGLWEWAGLPGGTALVIVAAWIAKDIILYRLLRRAHEPTPAGAQALVGRRGVVRRRLDPRGTIAFGVELWRAEAQRAERPIEAGVEVRVVGARGLVLIVTDDDATRLTA